MGEQGSIRGPMVGKIKKRLWFKPKSLLKGKTNKFNHHAGKERMKPAIVKSISDRGIEVNYQYKEISNFLFCGYKFFRYINQRDYDPKCRTFGDVGIHSDMLAK